MARRSRAIRGSVIANGAKVNLTVTIPLPAGRAAPPAAAPTGMVWNPTTAFTITAGTTTAPATFIFDTEDGTISAWNATVDPVVGGKSTATLVIDNSGKGAVYKGLAFGTNKHGNFLFATNFAAATIPSISPPGRTSSRTACSAGSSRSRAGKMSMR